MRRMAWRWFGSQLEALASPRALRRWVATELLLASGGPSRASLF
jgi:hypothetical protein